MDTTEFEALAADSVGSELAQAHDKIANLETALITGRRIGMAMGILMAALKVPEDRAIDILRKVSQHQNRKLRDIAEDVILTGTLEPG